MKVDDDSPKITLPPPVFLIGGLLLGGAIHFVRPLPLVEHPAVLWIGLLFALAGPFLVVHSVRLFQRRKVRFQPWKSTSELITDGVFTYTRNPIYLGMVLLHLGVTLIVNSLWMLLMVVPLYFFLRFYVIASEESYLSGKFGEEYQSYLKRVRRWV